MCMHTLRYLHYELGRGMNYRKNMEKNTKMSLKLSSYWALRALPSHTARCSDHVFALSWRAALMRVAFHRKHWLFWLSGEKQVSKGTWLWTKQSTCLFQPSDSQPDPPLSATFQSSCELANHFERIPVSRAKILVTGQSLSLWKYIKVSSEESRDSIAFAERQQNIYGFRKWCISPWKSISKFKSSWTNNAMASWFRFLVRSATSARYCSKFSALGGSARVVLHQTDGF